MRQKPQTEALSHDYPPDNKPHQPLGQRGKSFLHNGLRRAGDGTRTRDIKLGRLALYQLSYSRVPEAYRTGSLATRRPAPQLLSAGSVA